MNIPTDDLEDIAALLDGTLRGEDRRRVIKHLAESEDAYRLFIEAATDTYGRGDRADWAREEREITRSLDDANEHLDPGQEPRGLLGRIIEVLRNGVPRRFAARLPTMVLTQHHAFAALAVIAVAVAIIVVDPSRAVQSDWDTRTLVRRMDRDALVRALTEGWEAPVWPPMRGSVTVSGASPAFRLGVRLMDLQIAMQVGDSSALHRLLPEIDSMIGAVDLPQAILMMYRQLGASGSSPWGAESAESILVSVETLLATRVDTARFAYGKLLESARLAAVSGDAEFIHATARFDGLLPIEAQPSDSARETRLRRLWALLEREEDLAEVAEELRALIRDGGH